MICRTLKRSLNVQGPTKHVFLIGMPGSGKSTLGRRLASLWEIPFYDLDDEIEKQTGQTIPHLFKAHGEAFFREKEAEALRAITRSQPEPAVISAGGGTPCFHDNLPFMKNNGLVVFLNTPPQTVLARILGKEGNSRPLLAGASDQASGWLNLWKRREPTYKQAHLIVDPTAYSDEELAAWIISQGL